MWRKSGFCWRQTSARTTPATPATAALVLATAARTSTTEPATCARRCMMARVGPTRASESLIERMDSCVAAGPGLTTSGPGLPGPGAHSIHPLPAGQEERSRGHCRSPGPGPGPGPGRETAQARAPVWACCVPGRLRPGRPEMAQRSRWRSAAVDPEPDSLCMGTECCSITHPVARYSAAGH